MDRIQELYLALLQESRFNSFEGAQVAAWLTAHPDTWRAVLLTRDRAGITLRDLPDGINNTDTVYILTTATHIDLLEDVAHTEWGADEITILQGEKAGMFLGELLGRNRPDERRVLQLWWD